MVQLDTKLLQKRLFTCDVLVVGGGPAGLAVAAACAREGLETALVAPDLGARWDRSFGAFAPDVAGLDLAPAVARSYSRPGVATGEGPALVLRPTYLRFSTDRLQSLLLERAARAGVILRGGKVEAVEISSSSGLTECQVALEPGPGEWEASDGYIKARLVVNASGAANLFETAVRRKPLGYQSAYGQWIKVDEHPFAEEEMSLMDFRRLSDDSPSTFLYALPEAGETRGPGVLFVQETSLVSPQPLKMSVLSEKLSERLKMQGIEATQVLGIERCVIPMGGGLPQKSGLTLPFGASAGFTHPATGYQIARAFQLAQPVAQIIRAEIHRGAYSTVAAALDHMWPEHRRQTWRFFELASEILMGLSPGETRSFVQKFFSLPGGRWERFMAGSMDSSELAETMWRVFVAAPPRLRADLLRGGSLVSTRALAQSFC